MLKFILSVTLVALVGLGGCAKSGHSTKKVTRSSETTEQSTQKCPAPDHSTKTY